VVVERNRQRQHIRNRKRNSFRPTQEIRTMKTHWRQRNGQVRAAASHIQQMNIQLANVLSDVSGVTGQARPFWLANAIPINWLRSEIAG
jgi:hypothetical protein